MNNKKRGVLGIIFILVILLSVTISADSCSIVDFNSCNLENIVMYLSGLTNAHGELLDEFRVYPYVLCCDFTGIQSCDGSNKVLGLSTPSNAHAEIPENNNYLYPVCFADLECASNTGSCLPGYEDIPMLSLSDLTNAHLGGFDNYSTKICCRHSCVPDCSGRECGPDPVCGEICPPGCTAGTCNVNGRCVSEEAYWANINDPRYAINYLEVIPEITKIALVVKNAAPPNSTIDFEIYEADLFLDDEIRTGAEALSGIIDESGVGLSYWTITLADITFPKTSDLGEFYFLSNSYQSGNLEIILSGGNCTGIDICSGYSEETRCNPDTCAVANDSVRNIDESITCGEDYICGCSWDINDNECITTIEPINRTSLFNSGDDFALGVGTCNFNENSNDDCENGIFSSSWIVNIKWPTDNLGWDSPGECILEGGDIDTCILFNSSIEPIEPNFDDKWHYDSLDSNGENSLFSKCRSGSNVLTCPAQIQLAFFALKNFVIAIIIIGLIYIGYTLQKKNSKGKKKNRKKRNK